MSRVLVRDVDRSQDSGMAEGRHQAYRVLISSTAARGTILLGWKALFRSEYRPNGEALMSGIDPTQLCHRTNLTPQAASDEMTA